MRWERPRHRSRADSSSIEGVVLSNCPAFSLSFLRSLKKDLCKLRPELGCCSARLCKCRITSGGASSHSTRFQEISGCWASEAEEVGALLAVVSLPLSQQLAAIAVAHLGDEAVGGALDGAIAKRIHSDADRHLGERVAFRRARQNRRLVAQPIEIAEKHQHKQASGAQCDARWARENGISRSLKDGRDVGKVTSDTSVTGVLAGVRRRMLTLKNQARRTAAAPVPRRACLAWFVFSILAAYSC
jgi:hypothetical protein